MESVLITGGTGMIGTALTKLLMHKRYRVSHLTRNPEKEKIKGVHAYSWDPRKKYIEEGALDHDYIIHLAGANISEGRWTESRKKILYESRISSGQLLASQIAANNYPCKAYISASGIGYYGAVTTNHSFTESDPSGNDFLARLSRDWELAAAPLEKSETRTVFLRTPFVLSHHGGGLDMLKKVAKYYLLAPLGTGRQCMTWVHIHDLVHAYFHAITNEQMKGPYNVSADDSRTNKEFSREVAKACHRRMIFPPIPAFIIRIVLGEIAIVLTEGSPVSSSKIKSLGFEFKFNNLEKALGDCLESQ